MSKKKRILLRGGTLVTMNGERHVGTGDLYLEDGVIRGLGERAQGSNRVDDTIDVEGRLVIPGLIQPHIHLCQTLFRGHADDLELLDWLRQVVWPSREGAYPDEPNASEAYRAMQPLLP